MEIANFGWAICQLSASQTVFVAGQRKDLSREITLQTITKMGHDRLTIRFKKFLFYLARSFAILGARLWVY